MDTTNLYKQFYSLYGENDKKAELYFSPGRVNLIGEHTDYNGGYVFPCALSFGTYLIIRKNKEEIINLSSINFDYKSRIPCSKIQEKQGTEWVNYPLGVMDQFIKKGYKLEGLDMMFAGDVPNGAGLSSSASIEMATAYAINEIFGFKIDRIELVKMAQKAENEFVGMNCGIMDQFASGMGAKDSAIFLDCETLEYELVPVKLNGYSVVISNTNKPRKLIESKYNERRAECELALAELNKKHHFKNLGKIDYNEFLKISELITNPVVRKRAKHVISEDNRVLEAVACLKKGDLIQFGQLMNQSHDSLRYDYEVTGLELDTMVEEARKIDGVIGSRMTGAGFGGCTVSIVKSDRIEEFKHKVGQNYQSITGYKPDFYIAQIGNGSCKL